MTIWRSYIALAAALLLTVLPSALRAEEFSEGVQYAKLPVPVETADPSKVEVVEVFSYACIHCKNFDPALEAWTKQLPENVQFRRVPAIFDPTWALFGQAYYTAQVLGVTDKVHTPIFKAIHEQGVDLRDPQLMAQLFQREAGVDPEKFMQVFNSFGVRSRVQQADAHGRAYGVTGVPTLIVDGRYRVDGRMAGSNAEMLEVVEYLIQKRQNDGAGQPAAAR
jgi:thiol:disulfide interchange protein DsbA